MPSIFPHTTKGYYRFAVSCFFFIQGIVFASWASRIPDVKQMLHMNDAQLGGALLAIPLGQLSAMALSAVLVRRFGSQKMLICAAILYPGVLVGIGLTETIWTLSVMLFFFGMAANLSNISVNTQAVGVERLYHRSIMATFHGLWSLAGLIGGLIGTFLAGFNIRPFAHFCCILVLALLLLFSMKNWLLPRDSQPEPSADHSTTKKSFFADKQVLLLGLIAFGCMASEGTMYDWSSVYFESVVKPSREWIRLGYIASMCAMMSGRFMADRMIMRFGAVTVLRLSGIAIAVGLLLAILFPVLWAATLGFAFLGLGTSAVVPLCYSMAGHSRILHPGVAVTIVSSIGFLGFLLCPPLIGFVAQASSLQWAFVPIVCVGAVIAITAPVLRSRK